MNQQHEWLVVRPVAHIVHTNILKSKTKKKKKKKRESLLISQKILNDNFEFCLIQLKPLHVGNPSTSTFLLFETLLS